jgi:hypothetical protein
MDKPRALQMSLTSQPQNSLRGFKKVMYIFEYLLVSTNFRKFTLI